MEGQQKEAKRKKKTAGGEDEVGGGVGEAGCGKMPEPSTEDGVIDRGADYSDLTLMDCLRWKEVKRERIGKGKGNEERMKRCKEKNQLFFHYLV